jgi:hypothetical protein
MRKQPPLRVQVELVENEDAWGRFLRWSLDRAREQAREVQLNDARSETPSETTPVSLA